MKHVRLVALIFFTTLGKKLLPFVVSFLKRYEWIALIMFLTTIAIILMLTLSGCSTLQDVFMISPPALSAKVEWRKDLKVEINGTVYYGIALVERAEVYKIKIYPNGDNIDRLIWDTCHREDKVDKAVVNSKWLWGRHDNYFEMEFSQSKAEKDRSCPMNISSLEQKKKRMGFAVIIFPDYRKETDISSVIYCNGKVEAKKGVSACQSAAGLQQVLEFSEVVYADNRVNNECPPPVTKDQKTFIYLMPRQLCVYTFKSRRKVGNQRTRHIHYSYGYEDIPPMEDK